MHLSRHRLTKEVAGEVVEVSKTGKTRKSSIEEVTGQLQQRPLEVWGGIRGCCMSANMSSSVLSVNSILQKGYRLRWCGAMGCMVPWLMQGRRLGDKRQ